MPTLNNDLETLLRKSRENYRCAKLAHKKKMFNTAISRFYYSCFLVAKRCALKKGWVTTADFDSTRSGSHNLINNKFVRNQVQDPMISWADKAAVNYFFVIKQARVKAEYSFDDYNSPALNLQYESCCTQVKYFIEAVENIYKIKVIEEYPDD